MELTHLAAAGAKPVKRPLFQLYPRDVLVPTHAGLGSYALAAQGLWSRFWCLLHEAEPYGRFDLAETRALLAYLECMAVDLAAVGSVA